MSKKVWLYIGTACVAAVETALGVVISRQVALYSLFLTIPLGLFAYWKVFRPDIPVSLKRGGSKMLVGVGIALVIGGLVLVATQLNFKGGVPPTIPTVAPEPPAPSSPLPAPSSDNQTVYHPFDFPTFLDPSLIDPNQPVTITVGSNDNIFPWHVFRDGTTLQLRMLSISGEGLPMFAHAFGGKAFLDVKVYGGPNSTTIQIKDNIATVLPPNWDKNYDGYAYEVVNDSGVPIFQLSYLSPYHIVVNGIFPFQNGALLWATPNGVLVGPSSFDTFNLSPIFKYPSSKYQGQRISGGASMTSGGDSITQNIYGNQGLIVGKIGQINVQGQPPPKLTLSGSSMTEVGDGTFRYVAVLNVNTSFVIPNILIVPEAVSVQSITVTRPPNIPDMLMTQVVTQVKDNVNGITFPLGIQVKNASGGDYILTVVTSKKEDAIPLIIQ